MAHSVDINDDVARLTLSGDIDLQISGDIKSEIERLRNVNRLEIDASDVSYIDSSGVAVLILARQYCAQNNMTLALPSISAAVHRVLQIARLDVMLPIGSVAGADATGEFAVAKGAGTLGEELTDSVDFDADDDLVNSLLSDEGPATDVTAEQAAAIDDDPENDAHISDDLAGNFEGLDIDSVDFSEPAKATSSSDAADEEVDPLVEGDALNPGTFS